MGEHPLYRSCKFGILYVWLLSLGDIYDTHPAILH